MLNIEHTRDKLAQLGVRVTRLKGNDADKRRILQTYCDRHGIAPVTSDDLAEMGLD